MASPYVSNAHAAVSFGDIKAAALYFERVVPVAFASISRIEDRLQLFSPDPVPLGIAAKLIFGDNAPEHLIISFIDDHWLPFMKRIEPLTKRRTKSTDPRAYEELKNLYLSDAATPGGQSVRGVFKDFASGLGIKDISVLLPKDNSECNSGDEYPYVALLDMPLIDTAKATWEQIAEIRKDPDAVSKLRRLRLFFFENYSGKPKSYVQDNLAKRLDDYERARKEFGFDAVISTLSVLMDAKTLQAAALAALTGALFQDVKTGLTGAAIVELGKVAIEVGKKTVQIKRMREGHDLAYLIDLKHRLA